MSARHHWQTYSLGNLLTGKLTHTSLLGEIFSRRTQT